MLRFRISYFCIGAQGHFIKSNISIDDWLPPFNSLVLHSLFLHWGSRPLQQIQWFNLWLPTFNILFLHLFFCFGAQGHFMSMNMDDQKCSPIWHDTKRSYKTQENVYLIVTVSQPLLTWEKPNETRICLPLNSLSPSLHERSHETRIILQLIVWKQSL